MFSEIAKHKNVSGILIIQFLTVCDGGLMLFLGQWQMSLFKASMEIAQEYARLCS